MNYFNSLLSIFSRCSMTLLNNTPAFVIGTPKFQDW